MAAGRHNFLSKRQEAVSYRSRSSTQFTKVSDERNGFIDGSTRKRKVSQLVWDRFDEKQVKICSKNRVYSTSSVVSRFSSPEIGSVAGKTECRISSVESVVSNVSDDVESPRLLAANSPEDGEYVVAPNLSKSKWAFEDSPRLESDVTYSSPESGEFKQDEVFLSDEDTNNVDEKVAGASSGYLSSESDDENETSLCTGSGIWPSCRHVTEYERLGKINEGTYGVVHKARDKKTGEVVALKKVKLGSDREGFPVTALREINILGMLQHPSLVEMKEVVTDDFDGVYMVMECVDHELKGYMERMKQPFSQGEVKRLMIQLLEGVAYLHDNYVMHRDLKTSNLLLNSDGELKICDFGMSRHYASPLKPYTSLVVTLWYRAPELLLGMKNYSTAIDMWSVGCIMAELLSGKPLFDGNKEVEQIDKIFRTLGTPNESIWSGYSKLPGVKPNFVKQPYSLLRKKFPVAVFRGSPMLTELGFDLLNKFLTYDPEKRITAREALDHGWFREAPLPAEHVRICR
ncbi:putative protein-serine/threonine kinase CMGC-CDK-PITSLRE family [Helianthus annuus]|uniref:cyclin-dependent kinase n=1 Tax=Helianthus annuus TaxID=4232 RepID=A0A9K3NA35_HELAN|nr:cyclin-dependent kinase G-2 [Helianthus annuus]KAF5792937.1 putative protein-serine/threonine kinase CMGC-CDK-PITSLRE family [Helianthus annuus]KAJ0895204.1 putative protein-serine/threonine kinase CMGC-CDK-PITSLRE family [Helianthus annuus]